MVDVEEVQSHNPGRSGSVLAPKFNTKDKVFAVDTRGQLYQAVVKKSAYRSTNDSGFWEHLVHFIGWNDRHDRWIHEDDIQPNNEESRELARLEKEKLLRIEREKTQKAKVGKEKKQRKVDNQRQLAILEIEQSLVLPFTLKTIVVDDNAKLANLKDLQIPFNDISVKSTSRSWKPTRQVHVLPADVTVKDILCRFVQTKQEELTEVERAMEIKWTSSQHVGSNDTADGKEGFAHTIDVYVNFAEELGSLFDIMLPQSLLYSQERNQYITFFNKMKNNASGTDEMRKPCEVYSGEFLLRMIVKLPLLITALDCAFDGEEERYDMDAIILFKEVCESRTQRELFTALVGDLIIHLHEHHKDYFLGNYRSPSSQEWTSKERSMGLQR